FSSRRRHTRCLSDWSSDVCSSDLSVLVHGAAGAVGSMAIQLAREAGAYVIGTGRAAARQTALDFGAQEFVDLNNDALEDVGEARSEERRVGKECRARW